MSEEFTSEDIEIVNQTLSMHADVYLGIKEMFGSGLPDEAKEVRIKLNVGQDVMIDLDEEIIFMLIELGFLNKPPAKGTGESMQILLDSVVDYLKALSRFSNDEVERLEKMSNAQKHVAWLAYVIIQAESRKTLTRNDIH